MQWADILIGAALLLFGRRLFWLFVGGVGFIVGFNFAGQMFQGQSPGLILLIAIVVGLLGAIASIFLQRVVVAIAAFLAGGYFLSAASVMALPNSAGGVAWIAFVVGGIVGAILALALLDPALILLSSLAGATAISQNVPLEPGSKGILFLVLLVFGIVVQAAQYSRTRRPPPSAEPE
ncbi:MAG TPA: DUF4203 domain-containing protein [Candidatus Acidoferrales bacterium]|nr:DUF4203 domain-containing protein [Candidatus Acidoferrales bacterium]